MQNQKNLKMNLIETLRRQLTLYGLNPAQWEVEQSPSPITNVIHLRHKRETDFRIKANIRRKQNLLAITQLSVISI